MKLRFKDENGNNYPDWENKRLDTLANFKGGGTPSTTNENYWSGTIPWLSSSDLNQSNFVYKISKKISSDAIENSSTNLIPPRSILLVNRVGLGKLAITKSHLCTSQDFLNLVNIKINTVYLGYALKLKANFEALQVQGTSIKGIPSSVIKKWEICIPKSIGEQEKIGSFFKLQDEVIELKEKLIKEKRESKKGLLQKVFNQELRFKNENGNNYPDWEEKRLEELGKHTKGSGLSKSDISSNSGEKSILYGHLFTEYNEVIENVVYYSNKTIKTLSNENSILFPTSTTTGAFEISKFSAISKSGIQIGGDISQITFNSNVNNIFMSYCLNSKYKKEISNFSVGTTIFHLYYNDFKNIVIKIPQSLEEQEKIGNLFKLIDEEIELLENEVIQLKQKKKYYLSVMM